MIPFGETSDAPPSFSAALRKKLEPLQAQVCSISARQTTGFLFQAGGKDLLLKKLVRQDEGGAKGQSTSSKAGKNKSKQVVDEAERLAVIEAYRKLKNAKSK